jgi:hypothetical protein
VALISARKFLDTGLKVFSSKNFGSNSRARGGFVLFESKVHSVALFWRFRLVRDGLVPGNVGKDAAP